MNAQPWRFVVVDDDWLKARIRETCEREEEKFYSHTKGNLMTWLNAEGFRPEKPFLSEAPYLILVFGYTKAPYWLQSTWIAVGYLLLALEELGLGTVTYTPPNPKPVEELLNAPNNYKLQTILPVGYPANPQAKVREEKAGGRGELQRLLRCFSSSFRTSICSHVSTAPGLFFLTSIRASRRERPFEYMSQAVATVPLLPKPPMQ